MVSNSNADDGLLLSLSTKLNSALPLQSRTWLRSIYRVPETLRTYNEMAPNLVSIGPFHHGRERLQAMEKMKIWYLNCLLYRPSRVTHLTGLIHKIKIIQYSCRDCYQESLPLSSDEFAEMMVVDGCFIIELLCKQQRLSPVEDDDAVFKTPRMLSTIKNDLLLVENQLPWSVLYRLFDYIGEVEYHRRISLRQLAFLFFQNPTFQQSFEFESMRPQNLDEELESSHILETVRNFVVHPYENVVKKIEYRTPIPSMSELLEIGVKFVAASSNNGQLGITFENGVMGIPPIIIREDGECFIRNLIAYEQCSRKPEQCPMTSYAILLSQLIESVQDVDFLIEKKIIDKSIYQVQMHLTRLKQIFHK